MLVPVLTPHGVVTLVQSLNAAEEAPTLDPERGVRLENAFARGSGHGLLVLGAEEVGTTLPPTLSYWRKFGVRYVTALCALPGIGERSKPPVPIPVDGELDTMAAAVPPMTGAEYLTTEVLADLWRGMDSAFETELAQSKLTVQEFLKRRHPAWNLVGRVHFNLAENRKDEDAPFAFLATYTTRLSAEAKPQHLPLGKALQEYSGARNRERLLSLLMPVQRAAEHCAWLRAMVDAGEIFHPLRWSPQQAVQFLRDVPALESAGVLVRMPASWRMNRPARPQVKATVGSNAPSHLGMDALLDFRIEVTLDGENLKAAEIKQLLAHSDGLALIRGKWVEVDHERLSRTLEQFEAIERRAVTDGLSFGEAMRMLAGTGFAGDGAAARADVGATACFRRRVRSNSTAVVRTGRACASTLRRFFMELAPGSTKILSFFSCCAAWMKTNSSPLPDRIFRFRRGHPVLRKRLTIVTSRPCSGSRSPRLLDRIYPPTARKQPRRFKTAKGGTPATKAKMPPAKQDESPRASGSKPEPKWVTLPRARNRRARRRRDRAA